MIVCEVLYPGQNKSALKNMDTSIISGEEILQMELKMEIWEEKNTEA